HPVFVYTGMGPQRWGMGRELYLSEPVFRDAIDAIDDCLERQAGWSLRAEWRTDQQCSRMGEVLIAQIANFSLQVGLTALWRSWGVTPGAIVGHSAGEIAAAYAAGALSLEQAVAVIHTRARLQQRQAGAGGMLATGLDEAGATEYLAGLGDRIGLA